MAKNYKNSDLQLTENQTDGLVNRSLVAELRLQQGR